MTVDVDDLVHRDALAEATLPDGERLAELARHRHPLIDADDCAAVVRRVEARMHGLGALDAVLADPDVTDVMVGAHGAVWVERLGAIDRTDLTLEPDSVSRLVERVVAPLGLRADRRAPLVDARLPDGSRVHIAMPPLAVDGPYVTVRRFRAATIPLSAFAAPNVVDVLTHAVRDRANVVVSGATGAGKTTLLNALCGHLGPHDRVVTVEDAAELRLPGDHVLRLESRTASPDGLDAVPIRELVRNALRMRPDRIVIGEVRGAEALDMLQAMNTGHDGSLSTVHANGPIHALRRLETLTLTAGVDLPLRAVRDQIAGAVDVIVHVVRGAGGQRRIDSIVSVAGTLDGDDLRVDTIVSDPDGTTRGSDLS